MVLGGQNQSKLISLVSVSDGDLVLINLRIYAMCQQMLA